MPRSGSTFAFNVVREVLQSRGVVYHESSDDVVGAVLRSNGAAHVIVKDHDFDEASIQLAQAGAFHVIMTIRRVEDAIASWLEVFETLPEDVALQVMRRWLRLYGQLRQHATIVSYDKIDRHPWLGAWHIARAVRPSVLPAEVIRIARRFSKADVKRTADQLTREMPGVIDGGFSHYDSTTFLHRRHVSSLRSRPAEERIDPERMRRLRAELASDVQAAGLAL